MEDIIFRRAAEALGSRPTALALLVQLWPVVKDFDFSDSHAVLKVPMPPRFDGPDGKISTSPYSHVIIRKVLRKLELEPVGFYKTTDDSNPFIKIRKIRKRKAKNKRRPS